MKRVIMILLTLKLASGILPAEEPRLNLMPYPAKTVLHDGIFRLDASFQIACTGKADPRLYTGATRLLRRLSGRTGLFFQQNFIDSEMPVKDAKLSIQVERAGSVTLHEDESYQLSVTPVAITLKAVTDIGALRGMETLLQLLEFDSSGYAFPCVFIEDAPRFPWRGLLMDVCRHFIPIEAVKRNLDAMAAVKLNVLHLHLTEDQGFRIECKAYPKLHELGSDGFYYTHAQIREILAYANDRGIRVVPEFDMPGHTTSWFVGYPDLASAPGPYTIARTWGILNPVLDVTREQTFAFLDGFFREMCALFPDEYMHIGGDEARDEQWRKNREIRRFMDDNQIEDYHALQAYFNQRVSKILNSYHKKMMGWDEILHPDLPSSILIQSWRGKEAMIQCARQGIYTILSNGYYIDLMHPVETHYLNDPSPSDLDLTAEQRQFILGGEATMWAEFVTPETVDSRIWPRTAAIAERFWSPEHLRDTNEMTDRLDKISLQLEELGLTHLKNIDMMLRRLTGMHDNHALKILLGVIEPVKNYQRGAQRDYTSFSPMTRIVDIAGPDAAAARKFRRQVETFAADPQDMRTLAALEAQLVIWEANHADLMSVIERTPVLHEIRPMAEKLHASATIGLETLRLIQEKHRAEKKWKKSQLDILEKMDKPDAQVELMILPSVRQLLELVASK